MEFSPAEEQFVKTPDDLLVDDNGLPDPNVKAYCMNIKGQCRLCKKEIRSYNVDMHLITCSKLNVQDVVSFVDDFAKSIKAEHADVNDQMYNYCDFELDESETNYVFAHISTYEKFIKELEQFLDNRATVIFKKSNIYGIQRCFNILNYQRIIIEHNHILV